MGGISRCQNKRSVMYIPSAGYVGPSAGPNRVQPDPDHRRPDETETRHGTDHLTGPGPCGFGHLEKVEAATRRTFSRDVSTGRTGPSPGLVRRHVRVAFLVAARIRH